MKQIAARLILRTIRHITKTHPRLADNIVSEVIRCRYGFPVPLTHYYSPFPDVAALKTRVDRWYKKGRFDDRIWNIEKQIQFLDCLQPYKAECDALPSYAQVAAEGYGQGYGEVEACLLHCMVRYLKPSKVIEIGAGVSTYFLSNAIKLNEQEGARHTDFISVEPYPNSKIVEFARTNRIQFLSKEVQDVGIEAFGDLGKNDIVFIDSSHVAKIDSDVNWLYLEMLPTLANGVVIHIHDIPFPYLTTTPEHPMFEHSILWNEAALVKALMTNNETIAVLMSQCYLHHECPAALKNIVARYDERKHFPSSLWLEIRK